MLPYDAADHRMAGNFGHDETLKPHLGVFKAKHSQGVVSKLKEQRQGAPPKASSRCWPWRTTSLLQASKDEVVTRDALFLPLH